MSLSSVPSLKIESDHLIFSIKFLCVNGTALGNDSEPEVKRITACSLNCGKGIEKLFMSAPSLSQRLTHFNNSSKNTKLPLSLCSSKKSFFTLS